MCLCAAAGASAGVASIVRRRASGDGAANVSAMAARCISSASSRSIPRARVATPRRRRFAATSLFKKVRFGRENRDDSYRNTDLLKAIFCAFFDATVGVAHSETVDIDGGAAAMERASAARARRRLRRAFAAMRLEAVENEDDYAVYLADPGLDALECDGTAVIVMGAAVPACAAFLGDLELLRLARELGYEWNWETCASAAMSGQLECLKYARERGCDWSHLTCEFAAYSGNLECLKYAHERGCPWSEVTCANAAENGHLECLKYAYERGCPLNEDMCAYAASNGHLECLKYAHERGCPWNEETCQNAAEKGHLECLKYAHEHGCPWDELTCGAAAYMNEIECLRYAQDHGAPDSAHYVVDWQRMYVSAVELIVQIALSHQRDGYVSLRELTPTVNRFLRAWPELDVREEVIGQLREYFDFDPLEEPPPPRERFSTMIDLYATK